ncbi:hypothetical protein D3C80_1810240 [compost metagenome]
MHLCASERPGFLWCERFCGDHRFFHWRFRGQPADLRLDIQLLTPERLAGEYLFHRQSEQEGQHIFHIADLTVRQEQVQVAFRDRQNIAVTAQGTQRHRLLRADPGSRAQGNQNPA